VKKSDGTSSKLERLDAIEVPVLAHRNSGTAGQQSMSRQQVADVAEAGGIADEPSAVVEPVGQTGFVGHSGNVRVRHEIGGSDELLHRTEEGRLQQSWKTDPVPPPDLVQGLGFCRVGKYGRGSGQLHHLA